MRTTLVFGTWAGLLRALRVSAVSRVVNAAFVERHNGTGRGRCRRKGRKSDEFSKAWNGHVAATRSSRPRRTRGVRKIANGE